MTPPEPIASATPLVPPRWPRPSDAVRRALAEVYASGDWGRYNGSYCNRLRAAITQQTTAPHVWLCSSGTIAVEIALRGLKIQSGDEVLLAAYDFPGNFRAIEAIGARPVLIDLAPGTWTIDASQLAAAVSPHTKAVVVSHLHDWLADMRTVRQIADQHGLGVVEDACQVPGAVVAGRPAGAWGDCGVFSFGGSKLLTAGRGGAIVTSREDVLQRIKIVCERGNDAFPLSELQAAVLLPQLEDLAATNLQRQASASALIAQTADLPGLASLTPPAAEENRPAYYKLPWLIRGNDDACDSAQFEQVRSRFLAAVQAQGVAMDAGFRGFARRTTSRCRAIGDLKNARLAAAGTVLLHHPVLLEPRETLDSVARAIRRAAENHLASGSKPVV